MSWTSNLTEASTVVAVNSAARTVKVSGRDEWVRWWTEHFTEEPPLPFAGDLVMVGREAYPVGYVPPGFTYPNRTDWSWR